MGEGQAADCADTQGELSERDFAAFLQWNAEAMERCKRLASAPSFPQCVTALFCPQAADDGASCLLEQCARHLVTGVHVAANRAASGLKAAAPAAVRDGGARPPAATVHAACEALVAGGPRIALETAAQASLLVKTLQEHYATRVRPHVASVSASGATTRLL